MKISNRIKLIALSLITIISLNSCSDDHDQDHDHEEELITTVIYTLTNTTNTNDVVTLTFEDLDGDGSTLPTYDISGPLIANSSYTGTIQLLDKTKNPAEDITTEVQAESDEHEFFYTSSITGVNITKTDNDLGGNLLGIQTTLNTGDAGSGTITVILKHEPTKPNDGTSIGAGGSTDAQVTFNNVSVQ